MYPDKSDDTGKYGMVDIKEVCKLVESITLKQIKEAPGISPDFLLLRQPRLSVVPVSNEDWVLICKMGGLSLPPMAPWSEGDAIPLLASVSDSKNGAPHTGKGRGKSAKQNGTSPVVDSEIDHVDETLPAKKQRGKPAKLQVASSPAPVGSDCGDEPHVLKKGRGKFGKRHQAGSLDADESDYVDEAPPPKKGRGRSPKGQGLKFSVNALPGPVSGGVVKKMRGKPAKQEWSAVAQDQTPKVVLIEEALGKTTEVGEMAQENVSKIEERDNMEGDCKKEEWKNGNDGKPGSLVGNGSLVVVPQRKRRKGPPIRST